MKKLIILAMAISLLTVSITMAADAPPTKEQQLLIQIEKTRNARDYTQEKMKLLQDQFERLHIVYIQADRELKTLETQLDELKKITKKTEKKK